MFDELDSDCPHCGGHAGIGDCRCDGGDQAACGVERSVEFREPGRERVARRRATRNPEGSRRESSTR